ncbi:hypothetical protein MHYP_G00037300 [Metynnis hypsauchen]
MLLAAALASSLYLLGLQPSPVHWRALPQLGALCSRHRMGRDKAPEFHLDGVSSLLPPKESLLDVLGSNRGHRRAETSMGWRRHKTLAAAQFPSPFSSPSPSDPLLSSLPVH